MLNKIFNSALPYKRHITASLLALVLYLIDAFVLHPICGYNRELLYCSTALHQISCILFIGAITIGLVQFGTSGVKKFKEGKRSEGVVICLTSLSLLLLWGVFYLFVWILDCWAGGIEGLFMNVLPFAIACYYMLKDERKIMSITFFLTYIISLIYTYQTINLSGPQEFYINDDIIDTHIYWFDSYSFYRFSSILSNAFALSTLGCILCYVGIKLVKLIKSKL